MKKIEAIWRICQAVLDLALAAMMIWLMINYKEIIHMIIG